MRALVAAVAGLAAACALVFALTALGGTTGGTSPEPLLTTVPAHP
ncbi:SPW_0924 family protein [Streptomyces sp. NPDC101219]